jgi:hypothetical protein
VTASGRRQTAEVSATALSAIHGTGRPTMDNVMTTP